MIEDKEVEDELRKELKLCKENLELYRKQNLFMSEVIDDYERIAEENERRAVVVSRILLGIILIYFIRTAWLLSGW